MKTHAERVVSNLITLQRWVACAHMRAFQITRLPRDGDEILHVGTLICADKTMFTTRTPRLLVEKVLDDLVVLVNDPATCEVSKEVKFAPTRRRPPPPLPDDRQTEIMDVSDLDLPEEPQVG